MTASAPSLIRPRALLLDFGGVIITTRKRPGGMQEAAQAVHARLARVRIDTTVAEVAASLEAGHTALTHWKHAQSRRRSPRELTAREIVGDFLASDLADDARAALVADAAEILDEIATLITDHTVRPGVRDLLATAAAAQLPVGIVSNAHSGRSHRRILDQHGLAHYFAVQVYSDEVGVRKPNPAIVALACDAVGVPAEQCWYVGDTLDRDVVAGRRAGIGGVLITRDKHTDNPPFAVGHTADAVFESPVELAEALATALEDVPGQPVLAPHQQSRPERSALFIDHGGVISTSRPSPEAMHELGEHLVDLIATPAEPLSVDQALDMIAVARRRRADLKGHSFAETTPVQFWVECWGRDLSDRARAVLTAEATDLMHRYGRAKSARSLRSGIRSLLEYCGETGMPVVVVSNTLSGRAVRDACRAHGLAELIGAYVCSDENGLRKPAVEILGEAMRIASADPATSWFYGDKPHADAAVALAAGIGQRVCVRGGATPDADLDEARADGIVTAVVDDAHELVRLMRTPDAVLAAS